MYGLDANCEPRQKAPQTSRPRWMRGRSDEVRTARDGRRYIRSIGWEIRPECRCYTTCPKYVEVKVTWRGGCNHGY